MLSANGRTSGCRRLNEGVWMVDCGLMRVRLRVEARSAEWRFEEE